MKEVMSVKRCYLCEEDALVSRRYGRAGLEEGEMCPICQQPTCRYHLSTVRWRWRADGAVDSALVCQRCKRSYAHRQWDAFNRDWIT